jgi:four helix bundle protein
VDYNIKVGKVNSYKDLQIWQRSIELCNAIYQLSSSFPKEEIYGITNQMRRCSVSIPSNIAEGFGRSNRSYINFLHISRGSLYELDTQVTLVKKLNLTSNEESISFVEQEISEIGKMINSFINTLKQNDK